MSVSTILDTAKQALFAQQKALQVTGNNIANVNTPGYSREQPVFLPTSPSRSGVLRFGVSVDQVTRVYDRFVTGQVQTAASRHAGTQTQADFLRQIETLFNDLSRADTGLAANLDQFFAAFQDLANNPTSLAERATVLAQGETVAEQFRYVAGQLDDLEHNLNLDLQDGIAEVNRLSGQIARISSEIQRVEGDPKNHANTLRDERDVLLKELAAQVNITSFETSNGSLTVLLGGGHPLVEGGRASTLVAVHNPDNPQQPTLQLEDRLGNRVEVGANITEGELAGLRNVRNTFLPQFQAGLDRLAARFVGAVNQQHSVGYGLDGSTGQDFFAARQVHGLGLEANAGSASLQQARVFDPTQLTVDDYRITFASNGPPPTFDIVNTTTGAHVATGQTYTSGAAIRFDGIEVVLSHSGTAPQQGDTFTISSTKGAARALTVDPGVVADTRTIAAGKTTAQGDNTNALALANLQSAPLFAEGTLNEFYQTLVYNIGVESKQTTALAQNQKLVLTEAENYRESLAGVSLDEEQIDLLRFQQAFAASAQLVQVADELANTVINLIQ